MKEIINDDIFESFPNFDRFAYPDFITRVTAGSGGESLLIFGSEKTVLYDTGMAYCYKELIENIEKALKKHDRKSVDIILLSHTHYDHIGALPYVIKRWPNVIVGASEKAVKVFASSGAQKTMERLGEVARDTFSESKEPVLVSGLRVDIVLNDGDEISIGDQYFKAMSAKGHTNCSMAYILEPDSIMFASESTGMLRSPKYMNTAFLTSYEDTLKSCEKCSQYNPKQIIAPHFGIVPEYFTQDFFKLYKSSAEEEKDFILSCYDKGMNFEQIYAEFEKKYWSEKRRKAQPKPAFYENAVISINLILKTYR